MSAVISSSVFIMAGTVLMQRGGTVPDGWSERWRCRTGTLSSRVELGYFTQGEGRDGHSCFCTARRAVHLQSSIRQLLLILVGLS